MVAVNFEGKDLLMVAVETEWALMELHFREGLRLKAQDSNAYLRHVEVGISLVQAIREVKGIGDKKEPLSAEEEDLYRLIRDTFFVNRVEPSQLGYDEWNAVREREFKDLLMRIMDHARCTNVEESLWKVVDRLLLSHEDLKSCQRFFQSLVYRMADPQ